MKNLKLFVLAMVAAAIVMALGAGSASATDLTCGTEMCAAKTTIKIQSEGKAVFDEPFGNVECESTVEGPTENTGSTTETVKIPLTILTFTFCNAGNTVTVLKRGTFEIHKQKAGGSSGILTWTGLELEIVHLGVQCIFTTKETEIGTVTGSAETGRGATLDIKATLPRTGGSGGSFCGASMPWTGSYQFTSPATLNIDEGSGGGEARLSGGPTTAAIGETRTVTWENAGEALATIDDETDSDETVAKTLGTSCGTIAATGSCTSRKIECLKKGETTITVRDTPSVEAHFTLKCDEALVGEPTTGTVGETAIVTWKNNTESAMTIEDESISEGGVAETLGTSCGTIAATGSCTSRKVKCLKAGEATIIARDTPSIEGKFAIKCD